MKEKKGKPPAFQFYVKDWLGDDALRMASPAARGIWIDALCFMWQNDRSGELRGAREAFCRMFAISETEFDAFLEEANRLKFADVTIRPNDVTLVNRRMSKDYKRRVGSRMRKRKQRGHGNGHAEVASPSSSASALREHTEHHVEDISPGARASGGADDDCVSFGDASARQPAARVLFECWVGLAESEETWERCRPGLIVALEREGVGEIQKAFENFWTIVRGDEFWWSAKMGLNSFLDKRLADFLDRSEPMVKFAKESSATVEDLSALKTQLAEAEKTADYWRMQIRMYGEKAERREKIRQAEIMIARLGPQIERLERLG